MNVCVVSKDKKGKMQDNQDKETSTDEVQTECKRIQKRKFPPKAWMAVYCEGCVVARPEESYFEHEAVLAPVGLLRQWKGRGGEL
jgi:hypothetical protein